jgi:transcriptional regulator with XRE-family HTH domain
MTVTMRMARRLRARRAARGWSQARLAQAAGISRGYLIRLEAAEQDPTLTVLARLAKALKVSLVELVQ